MRYYKLDEDRLRTILADAIMLSYLTEGGVDNWEHYGESINDGIDEWLDMHHDVVQTWDDDDPRREDFCVEDIAQAELDMYYKDFLIKEKNNGEVS